MHFYAEAHMLIRTYTHTHIRTCTQAHTYTHTHKVTCAHFFFLFFFSPKLISDRGNPVGRAGARRTGGAAHSPGGGRRPTHRAGRGQPGSLRRGGGRGSGTHTRRRHEAHAPGGERAGPAASGGEAAEAECAGQGAPSMAKTLGREAPAPAGPGRAPAERRRPAGARGKLCPV